MIIIEKSQLEVCQDAIIERLQKDAFFQGIPIISSDKGDLVKRVIEKIGSLGVVVIVTALQVNLEASPLTIDILVTVEEKPITNRSDKGSGKTAALVAERIGNTFCARAKGDHEMISEVVKLIDDSGPVLRYQVTGKSQANWKDSPL